MGVVEQEAIDKHGNAITKFWMTHDQSFPGLPGLSVNSRLIVEKPPPCMFGLCLKRILHYIASLRSHHPNTRILMNKYDFKSAYHRFNLSAQTALESITPFDELLFIFLQMTFGRAACPPQWGCISKTICDAVNDLLQCKEWNHSDLHSPIPDSIPPLIYLPETTPFKAAARLAVTIPVNDKGKANVYIDNVITICPDIKDNAS